MTKISKDTVRNLAKLAKLNLTDRQIDKYSQDLTAVVGYMEEIKNIDVSQVSETSRVTEEENIFREDEVKPSLSQKEALKNSKNTHNDYFLVPQILKED
ncbi:Asp-tRNA(Asn)/Glu-tRNA(Gln) amidotransferase GatCAB subunit C [Candidatus Roizmanbacteria bacterium CG22_combo_CG10-13_8_21_14_all_35_9]|uniref:Aspartyl/glutamyl-tRNA(Asn/Gln) amidotransferase subunit C n=4 Tax=Candidatus Roizmaniibacteriota TaxID=1752723 RepID=A0A2M8F3L5_9BACT|nr:MAG: Asp-tRNA(Asn)/Glu-tRNA(Gln) amidotransferase GatCAB subunit C [Candidatus Roizmanbacteria bacterium CG23_combo_of_CG06-09_8_20_14_all_35_49]PIP62848.1 MAG: Asp-tRNA(Asn)/Glu-tRNA(Gln) amidotransferase GatCAB subunit C [Candidatus Roizmanbacteria bacterium CG22_combo_CG10-13_8_21_14_all_35_9]PIY70659.1 MAG: Asp-tRNA(Asn)/Glu-tRNA(Gln) amidotransferase GatCAB subunit C [Candidatus Roizmanbacteria bacterium CG_4_10_14_0_8_um_filter_35_28]PJC33872.1 MAG: Asp-tRNA(Asn)/Glu-tRNA(Gln) amidotran